MTDKPVRVLLPAEVEDTRFRLWTSFFGYEDMRTRIKELRDSHEELRRQVEVLRPASPASERQE